jgi:hypothetical protein
MYEYTCAYTHVKWRTSLVGRRLGVQAGSRGEQRIVRDCKRPHPVCHERRVATRRALLTRLALPGSLVERERAPGARLRGPHWPPAGRPVEARTRSPTSAARG